MHRARLRRCADLAPLSDARDARLGEAALFAGGARLDAALCAEDSDRGIATLQAIAITSGARKRSNRRRFRKATTTRTMGCIALDSAECCRCRPPRRNCW